MILLFLLKLILGYSNLNNHTNFIKDGDNCEFDLEGGSGGV